MMYEAAIQTRELDPAAPLGASVMMTCAFCFRASVAVLVPAPASPHAERAGLREWTH